MARWTWEAQRVSASSASGLSPCPHLTCPPGEYVAGPGPLPATIYRNRLSPKSGDSPADNPVSDRLGRGAALSAQELGNAATPRSRQFSAVSTAAALNRRRAVTGRRLQDFVGHCRAAWPCLVEPQHRSLSVLLAPTMLEFRGRPEHASRDGAAIMEFRHALPEELMAPYARFGCPGNGTGFCTTQAE